MRTENVLLLFSLVLYYIPFNLSILIFDFQCNYFNSYIVNLSDIIEPEQTVKAAHFRDLFDDIDFVAASSKHL